jgi:hypothetical protein
MTATISVSSTWPFCLYCVTGKMDSDCKSCVCLLVVPSAGEPACKIVTSSLVFLLFCSAEYWPLNCTLQHVTQCMYRPLNCTLQHVTQCMYRPLNYTLTTTCYTMYVRAPELYTTTCYTTYVHPFGLHWTILYISTYTIWPMYLQEKIHYGLRKVNRCSYAIEKYTIIYLTIGTCTMHKPLYHTWILYNATCLVLHVP